MYIPVTMAVGCDTTAHEKEKALNLRILSVAKDIAKTFS